MAYNHQEAKKLLKNKFVVVIGDSIQRGVYKDLVTILSADRLTREIELKRKLEISHCGDAVYEESEKTNAKTFREVRQWESVDGYNMVRFYFVTRVYSDYMETILLDLSKEPFPDVIIMNSCLWDMSRYGPHGDESYKDNLQMFFSRAEEMLPDHTLLIWLSGLPVSNDPKAGVLPQNLRFLGATYPIMVRVANFYAAQVVREYKYDYLDAHHEFLNMKELRVSDGVHWNSIAHRYLTNMILRFIADAWMEDVPRSSALGSEMDSLIAQYRAENPQTNPNSYSGFNNNIGEKPIIPRHAARRGGHFGLALPSLMQPQRAGYQPYPPQLCFSNQQTMQQNRYGQMEQTDRMNQLRRHSPDFLTSPEDFVFLSDMTPITRDLPHPIPANVFQNVDIRGQIPIPQLQELQDLMELDFGAGYAQNDLERKMKRI